MMILTSATAVTVAYKTQNDMIIEEVVWQALRKQIELVAGKDENITDVRINYQLRIPKHGTRNYLGLSASIDLEKEKQKTL